MTPTYPPTPWTTSLPPIYGTNPPETAITGIGLEPLLWAVVLLAVALVLLFIVRRRGGRC